MQVIGLAEAIICESVTRVIISHLVGRYHLAHLFLLDEAFSAYACLGREYEYLFAILINTLEGNLACCEQDRGDCESMACCLDPVEESTLDHIECEEPDN